MIILRVPARILPPNPPVGKPRTSRTHSQTEKPSGAADPLQIGGPWDPGEKPINSGKAMARLRADGGWWIVDRRLWMEESNQLSVISYQWTRKRLMIDDF
jgi:hypothetical protein